MMEVYEELGLTKNEWMAYMVLIECGKLSASEVSLKSKVSYGKIYNVLNSLIDKGFVKVIPEKYKKFSPTDPNFFNEVVENRKKELDKIKEITKEFKKKYDNKSKNPVIMDIGRKGFYNIVKNLEHSKKYNYAVKWDAELHPDRIKGSLRLKKERVDNKNLVRYDKDTEKNVKEWLKIKKNIRKIDNEGIALSIQDDKAVMICLIKSNVTLLIKDEPFAKIMKKFFMNTFNISETIK